MFDREDSPSQEDIYTTPDWPKVTVMTSRVSHALLFALYQLSIALGIVLLPLALVARQAGVTLPVHKLLETVGDAYENTQ